MEKGYANLRRLTNFAKDGSLDNWSKKMISIREKDSRFDTGIIR